VNSPVRAFGAVGGSPPFIVRGKGAFIFDADGKKYIDFCGSWGPLILGHARREVVAAVSSAAKDGLSFGACSPREIEMAALIRYLVPDIEMSRMLSSGTEAAMTALRLARGFTGRDKIVKFDGCYHGHSDSMLVSAGSGLATAGISSSAGVTRGAVADSFSVPYNSLYAVENLFKKQGKKIAALIVEPVAGNMGLVNPETGFLCGLREICSRYGTLLIFDEVISGFRLHPGTCGQLFGISPDIYVLGKIIGGGMPLGAIGGSREIMENLSPSGKVYQAGTLSGNPISLAAGIATLKILRDENPYPKIAKLASSLRSYVSELERKYPIKIACMGGMFTIFFTGEKRIPRNFSDVKKCDVANFAKFHRLMLIDGIYLPPSQFEVAFISAAHNEKQITFFQKKILSALKKIFK